jgi:hypothetical protein
MSRAWCCDVPAAGTWESLACIAIALTDEGQHERCSKSATRHGVVKALYGMFLHPDARVWRGEGSCDNGISGACKPVLAQTPGTV